MTLFLILAPFATFAALMMLTSVKITLAASALVALGVLGWDVAHGRSIKALAAGALVIFAGLLGYHLLAETALSPTGIRLAVDGGVLAIALVSLAIRYPFTLQYAHETVDAETRERPLFMRTNYILTGVWSAAFILMLVADVVSIYLPSMPLWTCAAIAFAARNSASLFTQWYPKRVRAEAEIAAGISAKPA